MTEQPRLVIPPHVLAQLRAHRDAQRAERGEQRAGPRVSFGDTIRGLFATGDAKAAAQVFVEGMRTAQISVEDEHDAFLLDPGMGPMTYLAADGRVLLDMRTWDFDEEDRELREARTDEEVVQALRAGAQKTGIGALLELLPPPPADSRACPCCNGRGNVKLPGAADPKARMMCFICGGRGWVTDATMAEVRARGQQWPLDGWDPDA